MRILMAEDNVRFAKLAAEYLHEAGHWVEHAFTFHDFQDLSKVYTYDLYIVDLGFPDGNGINIIKTLRAAKISSPILVMTACGDVSHKVVSLDCGADDFVVKPIHPQELLARVRALLRRQPLLAPETMQAGTLVLDCNTGEVLCLGNRVDLMKGEQRLLALLMKRAGHLVTKNAIEDTLIRIGRDTTPNAVEKIVSRLRKSLDSTPSQVEIRTVRGIGYMLQEVS
jgi:two-component system response regulator QseB/two-component system response regulator TctD